MGLNLFDESRKPAAPRAVLKLLAGLTWSGVGLLLGRWVWVWLNPLGWRAAIRWLVAGACLAAIMHLFFTWMAWRNIDRIDRLPERACIFAFQSWSSYPLVALMVSLGLLMRGSPLPRTWLAVLYLGIGGGLFAASLRYELHLLGIRRWSGWPSLPGAIC